MHLTALITTIAIMLSGFALSYIVKQQFELAVKKRRENLLYEMLARYEQDVELRLKLSDSLSSEERQRLLAHLSALRHAVSEKTVSDLSFQVTRKGSDQSVTLPPHYDRKAVSRFLELTA